MTLSRKASWTNSDGLVVGFGNRYSERQATAVKYTDGSRKELVLDFTFESSTPALDIPAGFVVDNAYVVIGTAWLSGTSLTIGDGSDADGWFTATALAQASMTAGAIIEADGAYVQGDDGGAAEPLNRAQPKKYASADTLDFVTNGTFTAGSARLVVVGHTESVAAV
jgi:hypothetical protein